MGGVGGGMGDDGSEGGSRARQRRCCVGEIGVLRERRAAMGRESGRREGGVGRGSEGKRNGRSSRGDGLKRRRAAEAVSRDGGRAAEEKVKVENSEGAVG